MGLDGLLAWFLRVAASVFCQTITYLVNLLLVMSIVPLRWKEASIHPVWKTTVLHPSQMPTYTLSTLPQS